MLPDGSGPTSQFLRQVGIPINSNNRADVCFYSSFFAETQICAGQLSNSDPKDTCQGDSGGPLVQKDATTGQWYLSGVTSYGEACAGRGVYVRTTAFESWIAQTIAAN